MAPREQVLAHLGRYRILPRALVGRLIYPTRQGSSLKTALGNLLNRDLMKKDLIASERVGDFLYYRLTPDGASQTEAPRSYAKALGPKELFEAYGELLFCCLAVPPRPKFLRSEFEHYFPNRIAATAPWIPRFYLDVEADVRRLGRVAVLTPRSDAAAEIAKALGDINALGTDFVGECRAAVALVCATSAQAARLTDKRPAECAPGIHLVVVHYPELAELISLIEPIRGPARTQPTSVSGEL